jgi:hypothetical protein
VRGTTLNDLAAQTTANFEQLFGLNPDVLDQTHQLH